MKFLVDTNVLIDMTRGHAPTAAWVGAQNPAMLFISTVTIGELHRGLHHRYFSNPSALAIALGRLERRELASFAGRVLPFDQTAAEVWGRLVG